MTVTVRDIRPETPADTDAFARIRRRTLPYMISTGASLAYDLRHIHPDAHYRPLLAVEDGEPIGTAQVGLVYDSPEPGHAFLNVCVDPDRVGRGAGSLLVRTAEEFLRGLGATRLHTWVPDAPAPRAFAEKRGYRPRRSAHFLRLDLALGQLPPLQPPPPGVDLRTGTDFGDDPRPLFALDAETIEDEPSDVDREFTDYEAWLKETWNHPLLSRELTSVTVVDGRPVAFSAARTDGTRYGTVMTGTLRAYRGRGFAKLAKNHSLHRARAAGLTEAFTGNDVGNGPMLAINKWFGYEICATEVQYVRELR
ncbi:GNAT family N-acetyltransferase [Streptomyces chiangmaiensis]|uniref:GNAT family N-acetyltransferase n=1 Tax=Streptomyces chiangmaiensis TaxID=766497 RepID=A0ABU7FBQ4_9ACTN|nr:GNAT family N-acetyltransferase [Streptomyces chiangmaiensis]MED7821401.1 GNAT family N-acetyltransferase [Streptomyces chiangmaiensis]